MLLRVRTGGGGKQIVPLRALLPTHRSSEGDNVKSNLDKREPFEQKQFKETKVRQKHKQFEEIRLCK